jgi:hypothetical protein
MTKEAIHQPLQAEPFKPFSLRLTDSKLVPVPHPNLMRLTQGGRTALVTREAEHFSIVDLGLVTTLEVGSLPTKSE